MKVKIVQRLCLLTLVILTGCAKPQQDAERIYGSVEIRTARLAFNESEIVDQVLVDEGDTVKTGQVLAKLKSQRLEAQRTAALAQRDAQAAVLQRLQNGARAQEVAAAEAQVVAGEVRLENAKKDYVRMKETVASGGISKQAFDSSEATMNEAEADLHVLQQNLSLVQAGPRDEEIAQAQATLAALNAEVDLLSIRLADTTLHAPANGTVESRLIEAGEMTGPSSTAFVVALNDRKWVRAYLPEPQLSRLKPGDTVYVSCDAWPDERFEGQVGFISSVAEFTPKIVQTEELRTKLVYEVRIWLDDAKDQLRLGVPVTVDISEAVANN
ncbi:efflux RND transporter periplasmic adaptor subunit [Coraliomargarita sp. W4R72]